MPGAPGSGEHAPGVVAAEEHRCEVEDVVVDEPGDVERVGHRGPALDQHLHGPFRAEAVEQLAEVTVVLLCGQDLRTRGNRPQDHPSRVAPWRLHQAHREARVVRGDRSRAHDHRVALGPQPVRIGAGLDAGDPLARAVGRGGSTIQARRRLEHHVRATRPPVHQVRGEGLGRRAAGAPTATSTVTPPARSSSMPRPAT